MPSIHDILFAFLLPAFLCGTILFVAARATDADERGRRWNAVAGTWAFGIGYLCPHLTLVGLPAWPSAGRTPSALDWLGWIVVLSMFCAGLFLTSLGELTVAWIVRALLACALVLLSLRGWVHDPGSAWMAGLFLAVLLLAWASTDALVSRSPGPVPVLALFVSMFCASLSALLGHSALVAELAGAACACLGASALAARLAPRFQLSAGAVAVIMLVFSGVLLNGLFFSDLHRSSALLSVLGLVAPRLAASFGNAAHKPWTSAALRAGIAAPFGLAAIVTAHLHAPA